MRIKQTLLVFLSFFLYSAGFTQNAYKDSMEKFIARYVKEHEVVRGNDKKFLQFYPINEHFAVKATFEKVNDSKWFSMKTSDGRSDINRVYGIIHFKINDTTVALNIYQSKDLMNMEKHRDYLFLPFTDMTSGNETYANGRYIDLSMKDIAGNTITIDFNKAYNPYCAYVSDRYSCPIPPHENDLPVAIKAGEKVYGKKH